MKYLVTLLFLACAVFASVEDDKTQWLNFKGTHGRIYQNQQEEKARFTIFQQNLRKIEEHNKLYEAGVTTYTLKVTHFADLTEEEFVSGLKLQKPSNIKSNSLYVNNIGDDVPESIDWNEKGAVSVVRNQGLCEDSFVFSLTGTLEGFNYVKTNKLVSLSGQQIIDCSGSGGCSGGDQETALEYLKEYGGIETEGSYPYGDDSVCRYNQSAVFLRINDFVYIEAKKEKDLVSAVGLLGPIAVELDASNLALYNGGIYSEATCSQDALNHAVLVVGYGKDATTNEDYWLVKNCWGTFWGEQGYFKIKRGENECGIASHAVYPVLA